jgi:hypothetical protein
MCKAAYASEQPTWRRVAQTHTSEDPGFLSSGKLFLKLGLYALYMLDIPTSASGSSTDFAHQCTRQGIQNRSIPVITP